MRQSRIQKTALNPARLLRLPSKQVFEKRTTAAVAGGLEYPKREGTIFVVEGKRGTHETGKRWRRLQRRNRG